MESASRIRYAKMYTIEHNFKVFDFGMVVPEHIAVLEVQWIQVMDWAQPNSGSEETSASTNEGYTGSHTYNSPYGNYKGAPGAHFGYGYGDGSLYQAGAEASYVSPRGSYYGQPAPAALGQIHEDMLNEEPEDDVDDEPEDEQEEEAEDEDEEEAAAAPPPDPFWNFLVE